MGLKDEYSVLQLFILNEGFLIEFTFISNLFNEVLFKPNQMGKALSYKF
jgi:hypothetical protein